MGNEDHITRAGYAVGVWNQWRDNHPDISPDLSGAKLKKGLYRKGKFFGANLSDTDFRGSNMQEIDLHDSNLTGADLSKSDLRGANLCSANLTRAELQKSNLIGADLTGADLSEADLEKAQMDKSVLAGAKLSGAKLRKTDLETVTGLTQEQVDEAEGDSSTKLPSSLIRPGRWPGKETEARVE